MDLLLKSRVAIVTGATSGLGRAIALAFAEEGAVVVVAGGVAEPEDPVTTHKMITSYGGTARYVPTDVRNYQQVDQLVAGTVEEFGRLDIMVNNAGAFLPIKPSLEITPDEWRNVIATNLDGTWYGCRAAIAHMAAQGGGRVINISSRIGLTGAGPGRAAYCASKGGVSNLTRQLAAEFGRSGITVNAICPGFIPNTGSPLSQSAERQEQARSTTPHQRLGDPKDVASAALYLASEAGEYVNGHNLVVDGGELVA